MPLLKLSEQNKTIADKFILFLFLFFPISLISGNLLANVSIILIGLIYFLTNFNIDLFKNKTFIILSLFFLSLIINLFFSQNIELSYQRVLKFFFIIFFILSFKYLIDLNKSYDKIIFKTWFFIILIFVLDLLIEFYLGKNLIGMKSYMPGRLAGFFGDELVAGYFYLGFVFFAFSYLYKKFYSKKLVILGLYFFIIFISLIIGERSNLIKLSLGISIFIFFILELNLFKKFILLFLISLVSIIFITSNNDYKVRYYEQVKVIFQPNGFSNYLKSSEYGAHFNTAYKMFEQNKFFGVGIKNFRVETFKERYRSDEYIYSKTSVKTHPHQIHFELLAETGMFGYGAFLIFIFYSLFISIKNYLEFRNLYQLGAILFILMSLIPYLPSGSFFSSFNSSIFWLNYAVMMGYINKKS
tara:strand:- start:883 stop:2121 length:1239 start_codon:yes stop_codon:yes gene_type:complete